MCICWKLRAFTRCAPSTRPPPPLEAYGPIKGGDAIFTVFARVWADLVGFVVLLFGVFLFPASFSPSISPNRAHRRTVADVQIRIAISHRSRHSFISSTIKHAIDLCAEWWIAIHYSCDSENVCSACCCSIQQNLHRILPADREGPGTW